MCSHTYTHTHYCIFLSPPSLPFPASTLLSPMYLYLISPSFPSLKSSNLFSCYIKICVYKYTYLNLDSPSERKVIYEVFAPLLCVIMLAPPLRPLFQDSYFLFYIHAPIKLHIWEKNMWYLSLWAWLVSFDIH